MHIVKRISDSYISYLLRSQTSFFISENIVSEIHLVVNPSDDSCLCIKKIRTMLKNADHPTEKKNINNYTIFLI